MAPDRLLKASEEFTRPTTNPGGPFIFGVFIKVVLIGHSSY